MTAAEIVEALRRYPTERARLTIEGALYLADLIETMADELEGAHHDLEVLRHELAQR